MLAFKLYWRNRLIMIFTVLTLGAAGVSVWRLIAALKPQSELILLHSNILFGVDLLGPWWQAWLVPFGALALAALNHLLAVLVYGEDRYLAYVLGVVGLLVQLSALVTTFLIVNLNV